MSTLCYSDVHFISFRFVSSSHHKQQIEYEPKQGISWHVDQTQYFADGIVSVSLGSDCVMQFRHAETQEVVGMK